VTAKLPDIVGTAREAVTRLVAECRKGGPLYQRHPPVVAQVSRTAKWLLNAIERVSREPSAPNNKPLA
jgi:hypothetical protein